LLHADSTRGHLITHIRPSLEVAGSFGAGRIMQESPRCISFGLSPDSLWRHREGIARR
jgi:hypothetical protein